MSNTKNQHYITKSFLKNYFPSKNVFDEKNELKNIKSQFSKRKLYSLNETDDLPKNLKGKINYNCLEDYFGLVENEVFGKNQKNKLFNIVNYEFDKSNLNIYYFYIFLSFIYWLRLKSPDMIKIIQKLYDTKKGIDISSKEYNVYKKGITLSGFLEPDFFLNLLLKTIKKIDCKKISLLTTNSDFYFPETIILNIGYKEYNSFHDFILFVPINMKRWIMIELDVPEQNFLNILNNKKVLSINLENISVEEAKELKKIKSQYYGDIDEYLLDIEQTSNFNKLIIGTNKKYLKFDNKILQNDILPIFKNKKDNSISIYEKEIILPIIQNFKKNKTSVKKYNFEFPTTNKWEGLLLKDFSLIEKLKSVTKPTKP